MAFHSTVNYQNNEFFILFAVNFSHRRRAWNMLWNTSFLTPHDFSSKKNMLILKGEVMIVGHPCGS